MGRVHSQLSVNKDVLRQYRSMEVCKVGQALQIFVRDFGFHNPFLDELAYNAVFHCMWRDEAPLHFRHFVRSGSREHDIGALELFAVAYLLVDGKRMPYVDKLDALAALFQFQPVPASFDPDFTYNEPRPEIDRDQLALMLECTALGLCKFAQHGSTANTAGARAIGTATGTTQAQRSALPGSDRVLVPRTAIQHVVDDIFSEHDDQPSYPMAWSKVKHALMLQHEVYLMLHSFADILFLPHLQVNVDAICATIIEEYNSLANPLALLTRFMTNTAARRGDIDAFSVSAEGDALGALPNAVSLDVSDDDSTGSGSSSQKGRNKKRNGRRRGSSSIAPGGSAGKGGKGSKGGGRRGSKGRRGSRRGSGGSREKANGDQQVGSDAAGSQRKKSGGRVRKRPTIMRIMPTNAAAAAASAFNRRSARRLLHGSRHTIAGSGTAVGFGTAAAGGAMGRVSSTQIGIGAGRKIGAFGSLDLSSMDVGDRDGTETGGARGPLIPQSPSGAANRQRARPNFGRSLSGRGRHFSGFIDPHQQSASDLGKSRRNTAKFLTNLSLKVPQCVDLLVSAVKSLSTAALKDGGATAPAGPGGGMDKRVPSFSASFGSKLGGGLESDGSLLGDDQSVASANMLLQVMSVAQHNHSLPQAPRPFTKKEEAHLREILNNICTDEEWIGASMFTDLCRSLVAFLVVDAHSSNSRVIYPNHFAYLVRLSEKEVLKSNIAAAVHTASKANLHAAGKGVRGGTGEAIVDSMALMGAASEKTMEDLTQFILERREERKFEQALLAANARGAHTRTAAAGADAAGDRVRDRTEGASRNASGGDKGGRDGVSGGGRGGGDGFRRLPGRLAGGEDEHLQDQRGVGASLLLLPGHGEDELLDDENDDEEEGGEADQHSTDSGSTTSDLSDDVSFGTSGTEDLAAKQRRRSAKGGARRATMTVRDEANAADGAGADSSIMSISRTDWVEFKARHFWRTAKIDKHLQAAFVAVYREQRAASAAAKEAHAQAQAQQQMLSHSIYSRSAVIDHSMSQSQDQQHQQQQGIAPSSSNHSLHSIGSLGQGSNSVFSARGGSSAITALSIHVDQVPALVRRLLGPDTLKFIEKKLRRKEDSGAYDLAMEHISYLEQWVIAACTNTRVADSALTSSADVAGATAAGGGAGGAGSAGVVETKTTTVMWESLMRVQDELDKQIEGLKVYFRTLVHM